jgi:hypothetical protein
MSLARPPGPDFGHIHGLNEYVGVKSLMECRDFLYRLVKIYATRSDARVVRPPEAAVQLPYEVAVTAAGRA